MNISPEIQNLNSQLGQSFHKAVTDFIEQCSDNPAAQTAILTTYTLSLWQDAARGKTLRLPSFILLNAARTSQNPIITAMDKVHPNERKLDPNRVGTKSFAGGTPEMAAPRMRHAVIEQARKSTTGTIARGITEEEHYHDIRLTGFGKGEHSQCAQAFHPQLGLITDKRDAIILHLDDPKDIKVFRRDAIETPSTIQQPAGPGHELEIVNKDLAISGALTLDNCDDKLVDSILNLGKPFFFIPHNTSTPVTIPNIPALSAFSKFATMSANMPAVTPTQAPNDSWSNYYNDYVWNRLTHLPVNYRSSVLECVNKLSIACENIALITAKLGGAGNAVVTKITADLYIHTLRGITIGLAYLAWHGLGFDPGYPLPLVRKLLRMLREKETMSLRDVQRLARFGNAAIRDDVLARLAVEGLVTVDGKKVTAVTHANFIDGLYAREEFPMAALVSDKDH